MLISKAKRYGNYDANLILPIIDTPASATFQITDTRLYVPVVTLSTETDKKLLEQLRSGFQRTIKWNKYRLQMTILTQNNNLNYLIDPTVTMVNRLFVLSFERNTEGDHRDSFSHCYVPNLKMKDFNVLIDGKSFFDFPIKNEEEAYEKIIEMSINNDYTTGNLLNFPYFKKKLQINCNWFEWQTKLKDQQKSNFIGKLRNQYDGVTVFFIIEKSGETTFEFSQNSVKILSKWKRKRL